jgi:hypothetical protein
MKVKEQTNKEQYEKLKAINELLDDLEINDGYVFFIRELNEEIQKKYGALLAGTKEQFDENKGYIRGLNFLPRWISSYRDRFKALKEPK